jgi:hypothetical protein
MPPPSPAERDDYWALGENAREHLNGVVMDLYKRLKDLSRLHAQHKYAQKYNNLSINSLLNCR